MHAIAHAPPDALGGEFLSAPARERPRGVRDQRLLAKALAGALAPLMAGANGSGPGGGSIVGLDFDASVAWPAYDWMGVAKAALESVVALSGARPRAARAFAST